MQAQNLSSKSFNRQNGLSMRGKRVNRHYIQGVFGCTLIYKFGDNNL